MKLEVIVHPNSKKEKVEKDLLGTLHVYVHEPPLEGKANRATISSLADYFNISKSNINLISGVKSKYKSFEISQ